MPIKSLRIKGVGPFDDVTLEFDPHVNVLVGPNCCGKSSVLWTLAELVVYPFAVPTRFFRIENPSASLTLAGPQKEKEFEFSLPVIMHPSLPSSIHMRKLLKTIGYSTFVPSLRQSTDFRAIVPAPDREPAAKPARLTRSFYSADGKAVEVDYYSLPFSPATPVLSGTEYAKRDRLMKTHPLAVTDESVIQKMVELDYKALRENDKAIRDVLNLISSTASEITQGFEVKFLRVEEDANGLYPVFKTPDGELPLNCLSQGTQSIIQWLAHIVLNYADYYDFPKDLENKPGLIIIDEIDNHLHPSWQQRIIPALTKHFPNLQLFLSAHSPLIVAGLKAGQAHLLRRKEDGTVEVTTHQDDIKGWSADEILQHFMDVPSPTDMETAQNVDRLNELSSRSKLTAKEKKELEKLRRELPTTLKGGPMALEIAELRKLIERDKGAPSPRGKASRKKPKRSKRKKAGASRSKA